MASTDPLTSTVTLKVVFDCNVFLQALVNPNGPAGQCNQLVDSGEVELYVSEEVLAEVAEVLSRPRIRKLAPALTIEIIEAFILWTFALNRSACETFPKNITLSVILRMSDTSTWLLRPELYISLAGITTFSI